MFDLEKSQEDQITADPSIKGPRYEPKLKKIVKPQISQPYDTRSKTKATPVSVQLVEPDTQIEQKGHICVGKWVGTLLGTIEEATVQKISRTKRWSPENVLSSYLAEDHQSSF